MKKARITLHPDFRIGEISGRLFGAFLEPIGSMVNGSMYNPKHPEADEQGLRKDFYSALKETGLPVGSVGLDLGTDLAQEADERELGYWLGVPYWGRGLIPEAARELLRHGFEDLGLRRIWCGYHEGNEKSRRVQEKLGFRFHHRCEDAPVPLLGETRVGISQLMTREDWAARIAREE